MLQTNGSGVLSFTSVQGVPSGAVFCLAVATVPSGYLECNGASVSRTTYAALFAVIGTAYGTASGSTFNVPDLRGEFIRGFDNGKGTDSGRSIATAQSDQNEAHTHGAGSYTSDTHSMSGNITGISESFAQGGGSCSGVFSKEGGHSMSQTPSGHSDSGACGRAVLSDSHDHDVSGTSGSSGGESRPRNIAMMYVIKT